MGGGNPYMNPMMGGQGGRRRMGAMGGNPIMNAAMGGDPGGMSAFNPYPAARRFAGLKPSTVSFLRRMAGQEQLGNLEDLDPNAPLTPMEIGRIARAGRHPPWLPRPSPNA